MSEFPVLLYTMPEGAVKVNAVLKDESLWLTQLFEVDKSSISRHLKNIFAEGKLDRKVVYAKFATTTPHGAIAGKTQEHAVNCGESLFLREQSFTMKEFAESANAFLAFGKYQILHGRGSVTRDAADAKAHEEYDAYNRQLKFESDFDKQIKRFLDGSGPRAREVPPDERNG